MTTTLVSFLGRVPRDKDSGRYRSARYRFPDGQEIETSFFGLALLERLDPDRLALLGTRGSMWDVLIEYLVEGTAHEDLRLALLEAAEASRVDPDLVAQTQPILEEATGKPCTIRLIDYGRDPEGQMAILQAIAESVPAGAVTLDLTHGFRHLAALGLLSGFFLERVARIEIEGLYYGALDMTEQGITPVVRLDGLLAVQRWIDALDRFDQSGDYGVFSPLLVSDGVPADKARCLEEAAFHERNFNLADARRRIQTFLPALDGDLSGAARLFREALGKRLSWARDGDLMEHQRRLAHFYLSNGDYVRAAILAYEAVVTRECQRRNLDLHDHQRGREPAAEMFEAEIKAGQQSDATREGYWILKNLRNALAHGNPASDARVRQIAASRERLPTELRRAMDRLLS